MNGTPEVWNREELYAEVWEKPLTKVAEKYGVSAVALGKVCRKLQVPLPGRGYWAKVEFGKTVERTPLPEAVNLPVVHRMKSLTGRAPEKPPESEPTDPDMLRIIAIENSSPSLDPQAKPHKLVTIARRLLKSTRLDSRGMIEPRRFTSSPCLDTRASKAALERALELMNAIVQAIEKEGFPVAVKGGREGTGATVYGHWVQFALTERAREKSRRQSEEGPWKRTVVDYQTTGELEFRILGHLYGPRKSVRDHKISKLEAQIGRCVGLVLREGLELRRAAEQAKQREIEEQARRAERAQLYEKIREEEQRVEAFEGWVTNWARAEQMRAFIAALEKLWNGQGVDLSAEAPKGQRIAWMKQQADRQDPMLPNPPSILDRKGELRGW